MISQIILIGDRSGLLGGQFSTSTKRSHMVSHCENFWVGAFAALQPGNIFQRREKRAACSIASEMQGSELSPGPFPH